MNIEQLKSEWQHYNQKLSVSQRLNEHIIKSMIKERSRSRVSKIRRQTILYIILMMLNLVLFAAIFAGNPFDFKYTVQYIPFGILTIGVLVTMYSLFKTLQRFNVNINSVSLEHFLKATIEEFEKNKKMERWFGSIIFAAGTLTVFSFLPKKLENKGVWPALGETAVSITITLVIYFIAYKLGAFKNTKKEGFKNDLKELEQLKAISSDLNEN